VSVDHWRLGLRDGIEIAVLAYGATLQEVVVADGSGVRENVALGFDTVGEYAAHPDDYLGATIGRYANRIAGGRFTLDGRTHELERNDRGNCLHGGSRGFDKRVWRCVHEGESSVTLGYVSPDGEMGFPGRLAVEVTYAVRAAELLVSFRATTDAPTVVNLTNHSCWNLGGAGSGDVREHVLQIDASTFTPLDDNGIPTGETAAVAGTPVDFRSPRRVGDRDLDHDVVLEPARGLRRAASLAHPGSGRTLELRTTEPCLQVWTGGTLSDPYGPGSGMALETQHAPDSPNRPQFPSTVLRPGEVLDSTTLFRFRHG
jgi:aldose 1-epimerase